MAYRRRGRKDNDNQVRVKKRSRDNINPSRETDTLWGRVSWGFSTKGKEGGGCLRHYASKKIFPGNLRKKKAVLFLGGLASGGFNGG